MNKKTAIVIFLKKEIVIHINYNGQCDKNCKGWIGRTGVNCLNFFNCYYISGKNWRIKYLKKRRF